MGDRFYCQRDNLTLNLRPDRRVKTTEIPTYYLQQREQQTKQTHSSPKIGQVMVLSGIDHVYLPNAGWVAVSQLTFK